jgi:hypothetical protein
MSRKNICQFTLTLSGANEETPGLEDKIFEAGCSDALINFINGVVYLDFYRESFSFEEAVISAIKQVESILPDTKVIQVTPDNLVSGSEISKRLNLTRQTISLWVKGKKRNKIPFPVPVMKLSSEKSPLWKWSDVCRWLYSNQVIKDYSTVEQAILIENLNATLEERSFEVRKARHYLLKKLSSLQ